MDGFAVAVCGIDWQELQSTVQNLQALGKPALALQADVTDEAQVQAMAHQAQLQMGRIDVLVNNAGIIGPTAAVANTERKDWEEVLAVNLTGAFLCSKAVLPAMMAQHSGRIINISSIAGKIAYPLRSPYAVSKWGLIGLTMTLAKEVGSYNIQVNAVCPGPIKGARMQTIIERRAAELGQTIEEVERTYLQTTVLGRMVTEDEVAATVAFLASPAAAGITAQALDVAAGYGM